MRRFLLRLLVLSPLILALGGCALFAYSRLVSASPQAGAAAIAAGRPFCVQVPGGDDYRPAHAHDRPGRDMWGHGGVHHAVLVVGDARTPETYHWSYLNNRFMEGGYGPFPIVCTPMKDYFRQPPQQARGTAFTLLGKRLHIPGAYAARPMWPGDMVGYSLQACAPDFEPGDDSCAGQFWHPVDVAFRGGATPQGMAYRVIDSIREEPIAGLGASPGLLRPPGLHEYVEFGADGAVRTYIGCESAVGTECRHVFSHAGITFHFRHPRAALPIWREMHQRLVELHAQFER